MSDDESKRGDDESKSDRYRRSVIGFARGTDTTADGEEFRCWASRSVTRNVLAERKNAGSQAV